MQAAAEKRSAEVSPTPAAENLHAASGKDVLEVTAGPAENTYTIHFADSAMVSRTVSRGCITVNGVTHTLSEDTRQALSQADKAAQAKREQAYAEYVRAHDTAVARQQAETWAHALSGTAFENTLAGKLLLYQTAQNYEDVTEGVDWSQFEWRTYETELDISLEGEPVPGSVRVSERIINKGEN